MKRSNALKTAGKPAEARRASQEGLQAAQAIPQDSIRQGRKATRRKRERERSLFRDLSDAELFDDAHYVFVGDVVEFVFVFLLEPFTEVFSGGEARFAVG